jgi:hypothetical protein
MYGFAYYILRFAQISLLRFAMHHYSGEQQAIGVWAASPVVNPKS